MSLGVVAIQVLAFAGGLVAVAVVYAVGAALRGHDPVLALVLAGVVMGTLLGSCVSLLKYLADPYNQLPAITFWLLGSLASVTRGDLRAVRPRVGARRSCRSVLLRWRMNLMTLREDEARALGRRHAVAAPRVVAAATLMTAAVVSVSGIIGWIGLLIPTSPAPGRPRLRPAAAGRHAARAAATCWPSTRWPARSRASRSRSACSPRFLGTPFFIWLLATSRRGW